MERETVKECEELLGKRVVGFGEAWSVPGAAWRSNGTFLNGGRRRRAPTCEKRREKMR